MLTPDYFYGKSDKLVEMYQELEDWIIKDIALRLMKSGELSGTADRELWKLQQMGLHHTEIIKKIAQVTGKSTSEVKRLLRESVMTSFSDDAEVLGKLADIQSPVENNAVVMAMNAEMQKTFGELSNLTRTTMQQSQSDLINMLNEVDYRVASGMQSYSSAICEVIDQYAKNGVVIDYPTGAKRSLEAAVRCCIVTSMNQTAAQVTNQYITQNGIEYVLVSAHMGARHDKKHPEGLQSHDHWQGKVYKIVGRDEDTPNLLEATGYSIDPATGKGQVVNPLGLHGYNCRHSHKPWDKSLRNPYVGADGNSKIDVHESQELYEKQQQQRGMERAIRQTKRELLAKQQELNGIAETDVKEMLQPQYDQLAYKLRMQNKKYHEYCEANDLQTQADRIKVAGFKKKQSAVANGRATAYSNSINNNEAEDIFSALRKKTAKRLNKMNEHEPLSIDEIQGNYAYMIRKIVKESPENVKNVIYKYSEKIKFVNERVIGPGYTNSKGISVNFKEDSKNGRGAWTTTFHEIGHAVDIASERISYRYPYFRKYLETDFQNLVKSYQKEYNLNQKEAYIEIGKSLEPSEYHILSDLAGGLTNNQCKGRFAHTQPGYWEKEHRLEKEAFAHFFEAVAIQSDVKLSSIKEMFPNAYEEFERLLEEIG